MPKGNYGPQVEAIFYCLGGVGLNSACGWCGGHQFSFKERRNADGTPDLGYPDPSKVDDTGVHYQTGVQFKVNGKTGQTWSMIISYEPNDTFTARLCWVYGPAKRLETGKWGEVMAEATDLQDDNLQDVVEQMYDQEITARNGGIPI
jgi:hypothetical protein